jgi:hypothetical protein
LLDYADAEFTLGAVQADGATLREHLELAWRQTGKKPDQLFVPELPYVLTNVWEWFAEMHATRSSGEFGICKLGYVAIDSWSRLVGIELSLFELKCIVALDNLYVRHQAQKDK